MTWKWISHMYLLWQNLSFDTEMFDLVTLTTFENLNMTITFEWLVLIKAFKFHMYMYFLWQDLLLDSKNFYVNLWVWPTFEKL